MGLSHNARVIVYRVGRSGKFIAVSLATIRHPAWRGGRVYTIRKLPKNVKLLGEKS